MNLYNQRWLPQWPVVPSRLWLTAAGGAVAGLSVYFQEELWPHHPKAELWGWIMLGVLVQVGGTQLLGVLRDWLRAYRGPAAVRLLMWGLALPICLLLALLLFGTCLLTGFGLVSALAG